MGMPTDLSNGGNGGVRDVGGRFAPGNGGGPGRRPGTVNRGTLDARIIKSELLDSWRLYGSDALRRVAEDDPATYVRIVASVLPREVVEDESAGRLSAEQLADLVQQMNEYREQVAAGVSANELLPAQ